MARQKLLPKRRRRSPSATERITGFSLLLLLAGIVALVMSGGAGAGPAGLPTPDQPAAGGGDGKLPLLSPAGWPRGEIESYDEETVFEKINGKADIYIAYGFAELLFAGYSDPSDTDRFVDVYVYDMANSRNGFGIYRAQRSGSETAVEGGDEACASGASAFVRHGRYLVEIIGSGEDVADEVRALVKPVVEALGENPDPVREPDWFPAAGRKAIRFEPTGFLGLSSLVDVFYAEYEDGSKAFSARFADGEAATEARDSAAEDLDFFDTSHHMVVSGPWLIGVAEFPDEEKAKQVVEEIASKIGGAK
jgi:hypothetical protein